MIAMVKGTLMEKSEGEAVVMTAGGLGLRVMCSMNTLAVLPAARAGMHAVYLYERAGGRHGALRLLPEGGARHVQAPDLRKRHRPKERAGRAGQHAAGGSAPGHPHRGRRSAVPARRASARKRRSASVWSSRTSWRRMRFPARRDWTTRPLPSNPMRPHRTRWARRCWPLSRWDTRRRRRPRRSRASRGRRRRRMS